MHEMSLISSLIKMIQDKSEEEHFAKVKTVFLKVGNLASVDKEALDFAFQALTEGSPLLSSCSLVAEDVKGEGKCPKCQTVQELSRLGQACEKCGSYGMQVLSGSEVYIDRIVTVS